MIRKFITLIIAFMPLMVTAQLRYGISVGGSWSRPVLSDAPGYSLKNGSGFRGGLVLDYTLPGDRFAVSAAVLYERVNSRLLIPGINAEGVPAVNTAGFGRNFIEVPLYFQARHWLHVFNGLVAPTVFTGPSFRFAIGSRGETPLQQRRFQPGWDVGLGIDCFNFIQISAGYRFGLGNAVDAFEGCPSARLHTSGWFLQTIMLFDF